jgi:hypothetical protein
MKNKNLIPLIVALGAGLVAAAFYILSGRSSFDSSVSDLSAQTQVEKIESADLNKVTVKCKNGRNYQISFKNGQSNYDDLIFNACGVEGTMESPGGTQAK